MGILTYLKLGVAALLIAVVIFFGINYKWMQTRIAVLETENSQLKAANEYYDKQAGIDRETQEVKNEIDKAVNAGDIDKLRQLYQRLREHQRGD